MRNMPIELDLRSPSIVIVGRWNDAILNEPGWVARHVLQVPEGEQFEVSLISRHENGVPVANVWSFSTFAMSCIGVRLELFQLSRSEKVIYDVISRLAELLPHTPVSGLGVNFKISSDQDIGSVSETLETKERLDRIGTSKVLERIDTIEIAREGQLNVGEPRLQQCRLRLSRLTDFSNAIFNFNFHQDIASMNDVGTLIAADPISHWAAIVEETLTDNYGVDRFEEVSF